MLQQHSARVGADQEGDRGRLLQCALSSPQRRLHLIINRERSPKRPEEVVADSDYHISRTTVVWPHLPESWEIAGYRLRQSPLNCIFQDRIRPFSLVSRANPSHPAAKESPTKAHAWLLVRPAP